MPLPDWFRGVGDFFGFASQTESLADTKGGNYRTGGPVGTSNLTSNDYTIGTMAGEDIAVGPAMSDSSWLARRNLIVRSCAALQPVVMDRATKQPIGQQPKWTTNLPVGWLDAWDWRFRFYDGLVRWGSSVLRVCDFDAGGYPTTVYPLPNQFCRFNYLGGQDHAYGDVPHAEQRTEVIYSEHQRTNYGQRTNNIEWWSPGDPIESVEAYQDRLVGICRMHDDGSLGGENPTQLSAEILGVNIAALRDAAISLSAPGAGSIVMADDWEAMPEFAEAFKASRRDPMNRSQPGFADKVLKVEHLRRSPQEQQIIEQLQLAPMQVARIDAIPPMFMGAGSAAYGTSTLVMRNLLHAFTLKPYIARAEIYLSRLVPPDEMVMFDVEKWLRGSPVEQEAMLGRSIRDGYRTPNQARKELDMEPHPSEEADQLYPPSKMEKGEGDEGTEERRANKGSDE